MVKFALAAAVLMLATASSTAGAASQNCSTMRFKVSTSHPVALKERCAGTIVVNIRINGRIPYDSQSFGAGNAGLIDYGYGASVRLYQGGPHKGTLWMRAATSALVKQTVMVSLQPQN